MRWPAGHRLGRMDGIIESMETKHVYLYRGGVTCAGNTPYLKDVIINLKSQLRLIPWTAVIYIGSGQQSFLSEVDS